MCKVCADISPDYPPAPDGHRYRLVETLLPYIPCDECKQLAFDDSWVSVSGEHTLAEQIPDCDACVEGVRWLPPFPHPDYIEREIVHEQHGFTRCNECQTVREQLAQF